jgi:hypothetical protein
MVGLHHLMDIKKPPKLSEVQVTLAEVYVIDYFINCVLKLPIGNFTQ